MLVKDKLTPLYYVVDDHGLPKPSDGPTTHMSTTARTDSSSYPLMNKKYLYWEDGNMEVDLRSLFYDALKGGCRYYSDLQKAVPAEHDAFEQAAGAQATTSPSEQPLLFRPPYIGGHRGGLRLLQEALIEERPQ